MQLSLKTAVKKFRKYSFRILILWILFWYFCRPVLVIHYAPDAIEEVGYFLLVNNNTDKDALSPGEKSRYYMDMFPEPNSLIIFSLPATSRDGVELTPPFSRVDIYVDAGHTITRTRISHGFFERFYEPDD
ncbi:hypothetical protein [Pseudomonas mangiferae]|uniref:Uncharacterized protein n=1 Tax=Pseudomonas mangiferae TaxID=2593654 RepID=A0A553GV87_9PSED|nr:hypothetical protein [Pseudomonas mangiferae]TRX73448.1 hypothetical protein FM069_17745 [Pseudomonas mangiferae]